MATLFTRIIDGELPGHFVWRDDAVVGFLSINPLRPGHTLVVPRLEIDHWLDMPRELTSRVMDAARAIGCAQMSAFEPEKIGVLFAGLEVPHAHLHVVPINGVHDLDFANAAAHVDKEDLADAAQRIRDALRDLRYAGVANS